MGTRQKTASAHAAAAPAGGSQAGPTLESLVRAALLRIRDKRGGEGAQLGVDALSHKLLREGEAAGRRQQ